MPLVPGSLDRETRRTYWLVNNVGLLVTSAGFLGLAFARSGTAVFGLLQPGTWVDWVLFWAFGACLLGTAYMTANVHQGRSALSEVSISERLERWLWALLSITSPFAAVVSLLLLTLELTSMG
jgi:hypothetical protein